MTNSGIILATGIGCALTCAGLGWLLLSKTRIGHRLERLGIDPDEPLANYENWSDEKLLAYGRFIDSGRILSAAMVVFGCAGFFLIAYVWHDFPWVVMAACWGWTAWMLNERRKAARA